MKYFRSSLLVLCAVLILTEGGLRAIELVRDRGKASVSESADFFYPRPYIQYSGRRASDPSTPVDDREFNAIGFRGPVPLVPKPEGERRVLVFGGSTVLNGQPSLPEALEEELKRRGNRNVRVFNFGVVASVTEMDLIRLVDVGLGLAPDVVIFYGGGNDIVMPFQEDPRPGYPPNFYLTDSNPWFRTGRGKRSAALLWLMLSDTRIVRTLLRSVTQQQVLGVRELRERVGYDTAPWRRALTDSYLRSLIRARLVTSAAGATFVTVFQPIVHFKKSLSAREAAINWPDWAHHAAEMRIGMTAGLASFEKECEAPVLDLSAVFDTVSEPVFTDSIHIEPRFLARITTPLAEFLETRVLSAPSTHPGPACLASIPH